MKNLNQVKQDALEILNMYEYRHLSLSGKDIYFKRYISICPDAEAIEKLLNDFGIVDSHLIKQIVG